MAAANQGLALNLALQRRQAVVMGPTATLQHGIAVAQQVMRSDSGPHVAQGGGYEFCCLSSGDVL